MKSRQLSETNCGTTTRPRERDGTVNDTQRGDRQLSIVADSSFGDIEGGLCGAAEIEHQTDALWLEN